jgi:hypothetical protein
MTSVIRALVTAALSAVILVIGVWPADAAPPSGGLEIKTVPAVPRLPITLDGRTVLTDGSGIARFDTSDRQNLESRIKVDDQKMKLKGQQVRVRAARIYPGAGRPAVAMDIFWPVRFSFLDVNGTPIDVDRIESVRLRSGTGEGRKASAKGTVWLQGSRVVSLAGGLENKKIQWSIQSVEYASSNVVNSAQQRFEPANTQLVNVELLFYRSQVSAKDAFFGFGVGDAVLVTNPDGRVDRFPLGENSMVDLPSLPRGDYAIVIDGPGPRMSRPVAISRDQVLDLKFYSWLDIGIVIGFLAAFAIGTLWLGWWHRRAHSPVGDDKGESQPDLEHGDSASTTPSLTPASAASASSATVSSLLVIKGGGQDEKSMTADEVSGLADLESREVLLARVAGGLRGVLQEAISHVSAPLSQTARLFAALEQAAGENPSLLRGATEATRAAMNEEPAAETTEEPTNEELAADEPTNVEVAAQTTGESTDEGNGLDRQSLLQPETHIGHAAHRRAGDHAGI